MVFDNPQVHKHKSHFRRYRQIAMILSKYRLEAVMKYVGLQRYLPLRFILRGNPWRKLPYSRAERTYLTLEELGTTFIKLGQILSTRADLLPPEYIKQLSKLQSSLKQLPAETMKKVVNDELGKPVEQIFASFDPVALGVASIGQVHAATLHDGTEVVVKIQKPGVQEQVAEDMDILGQAAVSAVQTWEGAHQYDLVGIVEETAETLTAEMNYLREGHSAEYFAQFFREDPAIHIPKIFWESTTSRVLTMERIRGIPILDVESLDKAGFDRKGLAKRSVDLWLKMVFESGMFHADPHPGNLFVESNGHLGLIDFGMVATVDEETREHLIYTVKALLDRNADLLIDSLIDLGAVNLRGDVSRNVLRKDVRHVMGHFPKLAGVDLQGSPNFGEMLTALRRNHVQLPSNTFFLLKTLGMAQALGKGLDPDFDAIPQLEGYVKKLVDKKRSLALNIRSLPSAISGLISMSSGLPERINRLLKSAERGEMQVRTDVSGLEVHLEHLERLVNRMVLGIILAAVILALAIVFLAYPLSRSALFP